MPATYIPFVVQEKCQQNNINRYALPSMQVGFMIIMNSIEVSGDLLEDARMTNLQGRWGWEEGACSLVDTW